MKFYAIHELSYYEKFKSKEYLENNLKYSELYKEECFKNAYEWMKKQMIEKLDNYDGENMLWLWNKKPLLNDKIWDKEDIGKTYVLLKINLPRNKVLFSDFVAWHCVLNNFKLETFINKEDTKIESWNKIFDIEWLKRYAYDYTDVDKLQAVTGKIPMRNIHVLDSIAITKNMIIK